MYEKLCTIITLLLTLIIRLECGIIVIKTRKDCKEYQFFPLKSPCFELEVRASHDIHIALTVGPELAGKYYEIVYGGSRNTKSTITKDNYGNVKPSYEGKIINSSYDYEKYWMRFNRTSSTLTLRTGKNSSITDPVMTFTDMNPVDVRYFGISTGYHSSGTWKVNTEFLG